MHGIKKKRERRRKENSYKKEEKRREECKLFSFATVITTVSHYSAKSEVFYVSAVIIFS